MIACLCPCGPLPSFTEIFPAVTISRLTFSSAPAGERDDGGTASLSSSITRALTASVGFASAAPGPVLVLVPSAAAPFVAAAFEAWLTSGPPSAVGDAAPEVDARLFSRVALKVVRDRSGGLFAAATSVHLLPADSAPSAIVLVAAELLAVPGDAAGTDAAVVGASAHALLPESQPLTTSAFLRSLNDSVTMLLGAPNTPRVHCDFARLDDRWAVQVRNVFDRAGAPLG